MFARIVALSLGIASFCAAPALAGGDDYDPSNDAEAVGPPYIGFVRDARGLAVPDAEVVLRPKEGAPVTVKTNGIGYYQSHISKGILPDDVEAICSKPGYEQATGTRRAHSSSATFVEINCTLRRL